MDLFELEAAGLQFVVAAPKQGGPQLLHWGAWTALADMVRGPARLLPSSPDAPAVPSLFPVNGFGYFGEPALIGEGAAGHLFDFRISDVSRTQGGLAFRLVDDVGKVIVTLNYALDPQSGLLCSDAAIENAGTAPLRVDALAALSLPAPDWVEDVDLAYGSWSNEGRSARVPLIGGRLERAGRAGRPGFDGGPFLVVCEKRALEASGRAAGFHLASSGDFSLSAERLPGGAAQIALFEKLAPGEIVLAFETRYQTPRALAALALDGFNGVSRRFHLHARKTAPAGRRKRLVQLNSWEAVYFNVGEARMMELATAAARLGVERFVLDDGWFKGRGGPAAGLGDWSADPEKYPNGLKPLIDHVEALGLEFGLWVEPEMVNEDSELFRDRPDWILAAPGRPQPTGRNQLVLDLTRADVRDHLFTALDRLLGGHRISYLKWDCNRDLYPAASNGAPASSRQIAGLYALVARLRKAHPDVSIESCASGGGRIDFGILQFTDRFWASDSTDAIERVRVQRRASLFLPVEILGAHVGPSPNPWTGRRLPMAFRCLTAFFGHFGVELDPAALDPAETGTLKNAIGLYKAERRLIIDGTLQRLEPPCSGVDAQFICDADGSHGLLRVLRTDEPHRQVNPRVRLAGLDARAVYKITEIGIDGIAAESDISVMSGAGLAAIGIDADPPHAATGRLFRIRRV